MNAHFCLLAFALACFAVAPTVTATIPNPGTEARVPQRSVYVNGVIEVDSLGKVEGLDLRKNALREETQALVRGKVLAWQFEPFLVDGVPRRIRTSIALRLDLVDSEPGLQIEFGMVDFGRPLLAKSAPPSYPTVSLRSELGAQVVMLVTLDETGGVVSADPVAGSILHQRIGSAKRQRELLQPFIDAAREAVADWTFEFVEARPDGTPYQLLAPVRFTLSGQDREDVGNPRVSFQPSNLQEEPSEDTLQRALDRDEITPVLPSDARLKRRSSSDDD